MSLRLHPITFQEARAFIRRHHRHHDPPQGWKFGIGCSKEGEVVGVITVGRPVNRHLDDGKTAEVTRCCTDGTKNAASKLYAAAWRCARAMGYERIITYTLAEEDGTSLDAAGWKALHETTADNWDTPSRPRVDTSPDGQKRLWEQTTGA